MERIIILGASGCGKSTLARELGPILNLPVIHLDKVYWQPGWVESDKEDFAIRLKELLGQPRWIVDGNYTSHLPDRFEAADTFIYLDYPRWLQMFRVVRRIATTYGQVRPDMGEGCPEQVDWEFLAYCWNFRRDNRPKVMAHIERVKGSKSVLVFKHPRETENWLLSLTRHEHGETL